MKAYASEGDITGLVIPMDHGSAVVLDYVYSTGSGKNKRSYEYAVASLDFSKSLPHMYLDSRLNGSDDTYASGQYVQLEGNFNKYFRLFIPKGSSAGSLAVLSPDVMQTLIDIGTPFDIEIDGTMISIISPGKAYTKEMLPKLLICADAISKDLNHLEKSWRPVYDLNGEPYVLKTSNYGKLALWITGLTIAYVLTNYIAAKLSGR